VYVNKIPVPCGDCAPATPQTLIDHLLEQCETWREFQTAAGFCFHEIWDGFAAISKALEVRGFLNGPCVLVHGDLREYNLLAEVRNPTQVDITGVIDWDEACFAPQFMAYQSQFWLWISENASSDDLEDETNALLEPETDDDRVFKSVFLEHASAE
jgi:thiamine kinase-like enzyme